VFLSGGRTYDNFQWTFESASDAGNFLTVWSVEFVCWLVIYAFFSIQRGRTITKLVHPQSKPQV
jgi:hypothetical protein